MFLEMTFNIIVRMLTGKRYYGEDVTHAEEARSFLEMMSEMLKYADGAYPGDFLSILRLVFRDYEKVSRLGKRSDEFLQTLIEERRGSHKIGGGGESRDTVLDHLLLLQETQPEYYTDEIIKGLLLDCTIGGYNVPRHTTVFINAWTIHRDRKLWDDPTSFKPERFENEDNGQYKYLPFGLGRRACPEANMAQRVITVTLGSLIQCFEWKRISEELVNMTEGEGMNMPKVVSLEAMCKPRKIMARIAEHWVGAMILLQVLILWLQNIELPESSSKKT